MNALNALAAGDFRALLDGILSDDRIEAQVPCPCGQANTMIAVRAGVTVLTWGNVNATHGVPGDIALELVAYGSLAEASEAMDGIRREIEQLNGMAQMIAAITGNGAPATITGDFMVI
jgi:hypothetical protein